MSQTKKSHLPWPLSSTNVGQMGVHINRFTETSVVNTGKSKCIIGKPEGKRGGGGVVSIVQQNTDEAKRDSTLNKGVPMQYTLTSIMR